MNDKAVHRGEKTCIYVDPDVYTFIRELTEIASTKYQKDDILQLEKIMRLTYDFERLLRKLPKKRNGEYKTNEHYIIYKATHYRYTPKGNKNEIMPILRIHAVTANQTLITLHWITKNNIIRNNIR